MHFEIERESNVISVKSRSGSIFMMHGGADSKRDQVLVGRFFVFVLAIQFAHQMDGTYAIIIIIVKMVNECD